MMGRGRLRLDDLTEACELKLVISALTKEVLTKLSRLERVLVSGQASAQDVTADLCMLVRVRAPSNFFPLELVQRVIIRL